MGPTRRRDRGTLPRAAEALLPDPEVRRRFLLCYLGFCHLLRGKLRDLDVREAGRRVVRDSESSTEALRRMGSELAEARRTGELDPIGHRILEERLTALTAIETGCERIAGTPLPFAYTLLLHRTAYLVCLLLPFGLVATAGWATPLFTALIAYTFFGLDRLSEELEDPFGTEANDLALDSLCRTCEISVFEALGDPAPSRWRRADTTCRRPRSPVELAVPRREQRRARANRTPSTASANATCGPTRPKQAKIRERRSSERPHQRREVSSRES